MKKLSNNQNLRETIMSIITFLFIWWVIGIILIPLSEWKLNDWKKPSTLKTPGDWLYAMLVSFGSWITIIYVLFHYQRYN